MESTQVDTNNDDTIETEELHDENSDDRKVEESQGDDEVENSDILIINHDEENAENISLDEIEAGSETVDYDDSFVRSESAKSLIPMEQRNGSANNNESVLKENGEVIETTQDETNDLFELEQGVEATESVDEVDQVTNNLGDEKTANIEDMRPSSMHGSAASRISLRSAEKVMSGSSTPTSNHFMHNAENGSPRSQSQSAKSHRSNRSTRSETGSASGQPFVESQTLRQGSASSQVSRKTVNETPGSAISRQSLKSAKMTAPPTPRGERSHKSNASESAISRKSAKSEAMSVPPTPESARSHKSNASESAVSQSTVISNANLAEAGEAEADANKIEDVGETVTTDEITAEADAEIENNFDQLNDKNGETTKDVENTIETDAPTADDVETTKEVNLSSLTKLYCVAKYNITRIMCS